MEDVVNLDKDEVELNRKAGAFIAECVYKDECNWKGGWGEKKEHELACDFCPDICGYGCGYATSKAELKKHEENGCPLRTVECAFCGAKVRAKNKGEHDKKCKKRVKK